jgi:hypothetical protein
MGVGQDIAHGLEETRTNAVLCVVSYSGYFECAGCLIFQAGSPLLERRKPAKS